MTLTEDSTTVVCMRCLTQWNHFGSSGFSMLVTAFGMFAIPFCKKALILTALMSCVGISMGFLDTGKTLVVVYRCNNELTPAYPNE